MCSIIDSLPDPRQSTKEEEESKKIRTQSQRKRCVSSTPNTMRSEDPLIPSNLSKALANDPLNLILIETILDTGIPPQPPKKWIIKASRNIFNLNIFLHLAIREEKLWSNLTKPLFPQHPGFRIERGIRDGGEGTDDSDEGGAAPGFDVEGWDVFRSLLLGGGGGLFGAGGFGFSVVAWVEEGFVVFVCSGEEVRSVVEDPGFVITHIQGAAICFWGAKVVFVVSFVVDKAWVWDGGNGCRAMLVSIKFPVCDRHR